jgi:hypothetical protein
MIEFVCFKRKGMRLATMFGCVGTDRDQRLNRLKIGEANWPRIGIGKVILENDGDSTEYNMRSTATIAKWSSLSLMFAEMS